MGDQFDVLFEMHPEIDIAEKRFVYMIFDVHFQHAAGLLDLDCIFGKIAYVIDF